MKGALQLNRIFFENVNLYVPVVVVVDIQRNGMSLHVNIKARIHCISTFKRLCESRLVPHLARVSLNLLQRNRHQRVLTRMLMVKGKSDIHTTDSAKKSRLGCVNSHQPEGDRIQDHVI